MAISRLYNKTASIERLVATSGGKKEFSPVHAAVPCHIQPLSAETTEDLPGTFGRDFLMLCATRDIVEGDRVTIADEKYRVMGVEFLEGITGGNAHAEVRLAIFK